MLLSIMMEKSITCALSHHLRRILYITIIHLRMNLAITSFNKELILQCLQISEHDTNSFLKPAIQVQYHMLFVSFPSKSCLSESLRSSIIFCYNRANA